MPESITLRNPLDMHLHLREGELLRAVLPYSARAFSAAVIMPNLSVPVANTALALSYKTQILESLKSQNLPDFTPLMSLYITESLSVDELKKARDSGIKILKLYPKGATTNSQSGVEKVLSKRNMEIFECAENLGMILSIHGESGGFSLEREAEFGEIFAEIARSFPRLRVIMEHISDRRSVDLLENFSNLFATLTLHHITLTLDSVLGAGLNPHYFCKPILKTPRDRDALLNLALNAHKKVSFGSDSAPHLESKKLANPAAAGIFSAPILLEKLCEIFEAHKKLENLEDFIANNAAGIYGLENLPARTITLVKSKHKVPPFIACGAGHIVPLFAGEELSWKVAE